ncbi:MAG TPA: ABC transporter permease [Bryobacteraceae bacterium]|nr:ABC transporter permease [Bryobacteraceae bacterium]
MSIRNKTFIIGLIMAPVLFGGGFLGLALMNAQTDIADRHVAILDRTGRAAAAIIQAAQERNKKEIFNKKTGKQESPRYLFETIPADTQSPDAQRLAWSDRIRRGELFAVLEIGPNALHPGEEVEGTDPASLAKAAARRVNYYSNSTINDARSWLSDAVNAGLRRARLAQLGVDQNNFRDLLAFVSVEPMSLVARDERSGQIAAAVKKNEMADFIVPFAVMALLGMIVIMGASPMLTSIAEDKSNRVFEMMLGSATPFELMMGKVLASIGRSLTSSVFYVACATFLLYGMAMTGLVPLAIYPWFYVYLLADLMLLCGLAAALGASCGSPQDAQHLSVILLMPVMIPYFLFTPVMSQPNGAIATTLSLFPPFTPMLMLLRQAMPQSIPAWQPWVGLFGTLACTLVLTWAAARIFRVAILMQGKTPKAADLLRWAVRG